MSTQKESIINRVRKRVQPENRQFVKKNLDIIEQLNHSLTEKGWSQKDLAQQLNKSESEISKWLSGMHNLTLKSITKMETILGTDLIVTPLKVQENIPVKVFKVTGREHNLSDIDYGASEQNFTSQNGNVADFYPTAS